MVQFISADVAQRLPVNVAIKGTREAALVSFGAAAVIAGIDGWAAGEESVRLGRSAVVCQRAKYWIHVLEISRPAEAAGGVAAEVVAFRDDRRGPGAVPAAVVGDDRVFQGESPREDQLIVVDAAALCQRGVAGDGDVQKRSSAAVVDATASEEEDDVAPDGAVREGHQIGVQNSSPHRGSTVFDGNVVPCERAAIENGTSEGGAVTAEDN